jgi:MFS family permease
MVLVFFVTYVVFQPLATALIRRIGPRIFLSAIVITWGACLIVRSPSFAVCAVDSNVARDSPILQTGRHWQASVLSLEYSRQDSSLELCISCPAGIHDVSPLLPRLVINC